MNAIRHNFFQQKFRTFVFMHVKKIHLRSYSIIESCIGEEFRVINMMIIAFCIYLYYLCQIATFDQSRQIWWLVYFIFVTITLFNDFIFLQGRVASARKGWDYFLRWAKIYLLCVFWYVFFMKIVGMESEWCSDEAVSSWRFIRQRWGKGRLGI